MNELLYKSIREEESNPGLFRFLFESCIELDSSTEGFAFYPLIFSIRLTKYLGFMPQVEDLYGKEYFNMKEGTFQDMKPNHTYFLEPPLSIFLKEIILAESSGQKFSRENYLSFNAERSKIRNELLEKILLYYALHLPEVKDIRSHHILHAILT
jgi:DNA repair protein RecO (recombination protein O)